MTVVSGHGRFMAPNQLQVNGEGGAKIISFDQAVIAAGSEPITLPFIPHQDPRVIDSTGALVFDKILVAVGRRPNGKLIGVENANIAIDERGFIPVDKQMRTNLPHIFAIGDIVGQPMLAHKATHEGKVAAETAAGKNSFFDAKVIPSVAYTDPEVAWAGLTENEAKARGTKYGKGVFPWAASGRSLSLGRDEGITKVLFDENSHQIIGCAIVGPNAGD